jgi:hypothetical protein
MLGFQQVRDLITAGHNVIVIDSKGSSAALENLLREAEWNDGIDLTGRELR